MSEDEIRAAELALGILDGADLAEARARVERDSVFAADVAKWDERFAPLLGEIASAEPGSDLWPGIERALDASVPDDANVLQLHRSVRQWRGLAGLATAASVALVVWLVPPLLREQPPHHASPPSTSSVAEPMLIASLADEDQPGAAAITFLAGARELVVSAAAINKPIGRDAELWIIPEGGQPISLGVVDLSVAARRRLDPGLAARFRAGATVALTIEPLGGSPNGQPTGPIIAAGSLHAT